MKTEADLAVEQRVLLLAAAFAHPLRLKLLSALGEDSPLAVDTLALRSGEPPHKVRRHLNFLVSSGLADVARVERRRGALKRYFVVEDRSVRIGGSEEAYLSDRDRRRSTIGVLRLLLDEAMRAASNARLGERPDFVLANLPARVDEQGWSELSESHCRTLDFVEEAISESRERLEDGDREAIGVIAEQILLEATHYAGSSKIESSGLVDRGVQGERGSWAGAEDHQAADQHMHRARGFAGVIAQPMLVRLIVVLGLESPLDAREVAERVEEPLHRVRHHLDTLVADGFIGVALAENQSGADRRYYAIAGKPWLDAEEDSSLSDRDRRRAASRMIRAIFDDVTKAVANPRLCDRTDRLVANVTNRVDERGWRELAQLHGELLKRAKRIVDESRVRLQTGEDQPIGAISQQILMEAPAHA